MHNLFNAMNISTDTKYELSDYVSSLFNKMGLSLNDFCNPSSFTNPIQAIDHFEQSDYSLALARKIFKEHFDIARKITRYISLFYKGYELLALSNKPDEQAMKKARKYLENSTILRPTTIRKITNPPSVKQPLKRIKHALNNSDYYCELLESEFSKNIKPVLSDFNKCQWKNTMDLHLFQTLEKNVPRHALNEFELKNYLSGVPKNKMSYLIDLTQKAGNTKPSSLSGIMSKIDVEAIGSTGVLSDVVRYTIQRYMGGDTPFHTFEVLGFRGYLSVHFNVLERGKSYFHLVVAKRRADQELPSFESLLEKTLEEGYGSIRYEENAVELLSDMPKSTNNSIGIDDSDSLLMVADDENFTVRTHFPPLQRRSFANMFDSVVQKEDFIRKMNFITGIFDSYFPRARIGFRQVYE